MPKGHNNLAQLCNCNRCRPLHLRILGLVLAALELVLAELVLAGHCHQQLGMKHQNGCHTRCRLWKSA